MYGISLVVNTVRRVNCAKRLPFYISAYRVLNCRSLGRALDMLTLVLSMVILAPAYSQAQEQGSNTLEIIYVEMPPYTYTKPDGNPGGTLIDVSRRVLLSLKRDFTFRSVSLEELERLSRDADFDIAHLIGAFPLPKKELSFGHLPLGYLNLQAYFIDAPGIRGITDLKGRELILLKGYSYGYLRDYFNVPENRMRIVFADDHRHALKLLKQGKNRYLIDYQKPFERAVEPASLQTLQHYSLSEIPMYWAVSAKHVELLQAMEHELSRSK